MEDSSSDTDIEFIEEIKPKFGLSTATPVSLNEKEKKCASTEHGQGLFSTASPLAVKAGISGMSFDNEAEVINKKRARLSLSKSKTLRAKAKDSSAVISKSQGVLDTQSSPPPSIKRIHSGNFASPTNHSMKLSKSLSQSPNKFIPRKSPNHSPSKIKQNSSPSKKLIKNSPVRYLKNKANYRNMSGVATPHSPFKKLQFDSPEVDLNTQENSGFYHSTLDHINASNFCLILKDSMHYLNDANIFNEEELKTVNDFLEMPWQNKELYVRMYGRKAGWHRVSNIHYNNISDNLSLVFKDLERAGFVTYDYSKENLDTLLCLLQVAELKSLCKDLKLKVSTKSNKPDLMKTLSSFSTSQKTLNFGCGNKSTPALNNSSKVLRNKLLNVLNDCITLSSVPLQVFGRMVLLFSLSRSSSTEEREDVAQYLLLMHFVNIGKMAFPSCHVLRHSIFHSRDHFLSFEEARELESSLVESIEQKKWNSLPIITCRAVASLMEILKDDTTNNHDQGLPLFLRKFTAGSTYSYLLTIAAEAMKKEASLVPNAIEILQTLLAQKIYLTEYRGRWYEQLALLHQHKLFDNTEASLVVVSGLNDDLVTEVWKYTLYDRGTTLLGRKTNQPNKNAKQKLAHVIDKEERLQDPSSIKIVSKSLENNKPGFKKVYIQVDLEKGETTYSSVEEFALSHYTNSLGFVRGMHCEGAIIVSLFGLFFWDIIYELPIAGAFQSDYQSEPLDLRSPDFYTNRREAVDKRLKEMEQWNVDKIRTTVEQTFTEHRDKISVVNWDRLKSTSQVIDIVSCLSISVVTKICARLVKHFRVANSGFPDLIVWDPDSGRCKFVEVKGKGDQLSVKQRVWLDYLKKIGADAEVCHVHHS